MELRMYGLVNYQLSGIQAGIQFGHSVQEYNNLMMDFDKLSISYKNWRDWSLNWKTFIVLNGGTTNNNTLNMGTMNDHLLTLNENNILTSHFCEPDLGDQLTAITFIVDERVFDRKKWPDFQGDPQNDKCEYDKWCESFGDDYQEVIFLRDFLKNFRLF